MTSNNSEMRYSEYYVRPPTDHTGDQTGLERRRNQRQKGVKMRKHSALLAAALLVSSTGVGMAQGQSPNSQQKSPATSGQSSGSQSDPRGPGMTRAPSSTNPQAGGGGAGYQTPRETPEAGGAPTTQTPNPNRR